ncbi:MAG TPA: lysylphosphatidylglycerol synthase transmembrane domain-containing protein, partial [Balneolaceae bacterium]|nr:lysylphosphatidylglycerol synthase transmembrane domain-containing protein [Balneolaceae bacterium]
MIKKTLKVVSAVAIGGLFLWLAFRTVDIEKVWYHIKNISYGWIFPFACIVLLSNIIRSERWRLLIEHEKKDIRGVTLVAGVLTGYVFNMITPRLGEVSRPVYVAKQEDLSSTKMFGTIVLERIIDLATLLLLFIIVLVYLITDYSMVRQIFGDEIIDFFTEGIGLSTTFNLLIWIAIVAATFFIIA